MSWNVEALPDLAGRTYAVTGGNAGTGCFISEQFGTARADVVILGRNPDRIRAAVEAIRWRRRLRGTGGPGMISCGAARLEPRRYGRPRRLVP